MAASFKYFSAPMDQIRGVVNDRSCAFCGHQGPGIDLDFGIPPNEKSLPSGVGCFDCLEKRRFLIEHDTEAGLIDTEGIHRIYPSHDPDLNMSTVSLDALLATPDIKAWQRATWLAHCGEFMTYVGIWVKQDFSRMASDGDGRSLFMSMTDPDQQNLWDQSIGSSDCEEGWHASYYAFKCLHCGKHRGNWDCP